MLCWASLIKCLYSRRKVDITTMRCGEWIRNRVAHTCTYEHTKHTWTHMHISMQTHRRYENKAVMAGKCISETLVLKRKRDTLTLSWSRVPRKSSEWIGQRSARDIHRGTTPLPWAWYYLSPRLGLGLGIALQKEVKGSWPHLPLCIYLSSVGTRAS